MKNIVKILSSTLLIVLILSIVASPVFADYLDPSSISPNDNGGVATAAQNVAGTILGVVQVVGVSVAIIMLIVLAIKYMSAAPNDKAEIKKHAVVYVVGAVVLFGSSAILGIIKDFATKMGNGGGGGSTVEQLDLARPSTTPYD